MYTIHCIEINHLDCHLVSTQAIDIWNIISNFLFLRILSFFILKANIEFFKYNILKTFDQFDYWWKSIRHKFVPGLMDYVELSSRINFSMHDRAQKFSLKTIYGHLIFFHWCLKLWFLNSSSTYWDNECSESC